jgi:hypothetical protein
MRQGHGCTTRKHFCWIMLPTRSSIIAFASLAVLLILRHTLQAGNADFSTQDTKLNVNLQECRPETWQSEAPDVITQEWMVQRKERLRKIGFPWDLAPKGNKTLYVLFMGLEGSGHHKVQAEINSLNLSNVKVNAFTPIIHGWGSNGTNKPTFTSADEMEAAIRTLPWFKNPSIRVVMDGQNSCPSGGPRIIQKCPDPLMFLEMERRGLLELKIIYLARSFTESIISALHRRHTRDLDLQLRVEDISASYLWTQLQTLSCDKTVIHPFSATLSQSGIFSFISSPANRPSHPYNLDKMIVCQNRSITGDECFQYVKQRIVGFAKVHRVKWPWLPV